MSEKEGGYYDSYKQMREFIENLEALDGLGSPLPAKKINKVPIQDVTDEFIAEMIEHWVQMFSGHHTDQGRKEFVLEVFNDLRTINIPEDWYPFVQSVVEWLRLSAPDQMYGNLSIFLFGYLWRMNIEDEPLE